MDRQRLTRNGIFATIVVVGGALAVGYGRHLIRLDPFANFEHAEPSQQSIMASLKDVDVVQYNKDKLMGSAHVGELDLRQDQRTYDLSKVYNGILYTDHGRIDFTADHGTWDAGRLQFAVDTGAHVVNKDFNLQVASFTFDQNTGVLQVPREIRGHFLGGEITAKTFMYNVNTKDTSVGPAMWTGRPNFKQDTGDTGNTSWTFKTEGMVSHKSGIEIWHKAEATDGEVIVSGDQIERNEKTDVITATGNCLYFSKKANMACDKVVVYRKDKRAVLSGNVRMLVKPKDSMEKELKPDTGEIPVFHPDVPADVAAQAGGEITGESPADKEADDEVRSGKSTRKYPTVILSSQVEYWYAKGNRHAIITGSPQATQTLQGARWRRVWANKGLYDGEKDSVRLESTPGKSDVIMKNSTGDDIQATWFEFSTQEDNEDWQGSGMKGTVVQTEKSDEETGGTQPPPDTNVAPPPADAGKKPPQ